MCLFSLCSILAWFTSPLHNKKVQLNDENAESNDWDVRLQIVPEFEGVLELLAEVQGFEVEVDEGQFTPLMGDLADVQNTADVQSMQDIQSTANVENGVIVRNNWHVDDGDFGQAAVVVIQDGEEGGGEQQPGMMLMPGGLQTIEEETEEELTAFEHGEQ